MKRNITAIVLCVVCTTATMFSACEGTDNVPKYAYEQKSLRFVEKDGDSLIYCDYADYTEAESAAYYFDPALSEEDKNKCVYRTEQILSKVDSTPITVCVFSSDTYRETYLEEGVLYTHIQDFTAVDYVADVLLASFGMYCNYGLAYGYANYVAKESGWAYGAQDSIPTTPHDYLYDTNLLCFSTQYVTQEDVSFSKAFGIYFVNDYIAENGIKAFETLLKDSGDTEQTERFSTVRNGWYQKTALHTRRQTFSIAKAGKLTNLSQITSMLFFGFVKTGRSSPPNAIRLLKRASYMKVIRK